MARRDPEIEAHRDWLGLLQPIGLVVSPPALARAQAVVERNPIALQQTLEATVSRGPDGDEDAFIEDFPRFTREVLEWEAEDLAGAPDGPELPEALDVALTEYGDVLSPTYAVVDPDNPDGWLMLVALHARGVDLDVPLESRGWQASPQARMERLLRERELPVGLLCNADQIRLVYAPRGETSGHLTFPVQAMTEVPGRVLLGALELLLGADRLFNEGSGRQLIDLLTESRKYQVEVSNKLSEQVLDALWTLLAGFQSADESAKGALLSEVAREEPEHIYGGLLTALLRLVFLLYAEDQGLMPDDEVYTTHYAVAGLYEQLREDAALYPDTMNQRYGAWAALLSLFRLVYQGGGHGGIALPPRQGQLFDPDAYPFLEGRPRAGAWQPDATLDSVPQVSDGSVYRVLDALLILKGKSKHDEGERLSYRSLDVEQIGSVYEAMMGFEVERASAPSIGLKPKHIVVSLTGLLAQPPAKRKKWLQDKAECKLTAKENKALKAATTPAEAIAALGRKVSPRTRSLLQKGALYLQPGEERRRSGSHYTPRELTAPIVETTLRPVLEALGQKPTPAQILDLKVCDPAMGSGAFLVEACRQLAEHLVEAWNHHEATPDDIPPDETPLLHARRLVAQRCLYGVDKNPFAVNLARLSLWLVTLAKDHPFTFLDHALKCGDSLVGMTKAQIAMFRWDATTEHADLPLLATIQKNIGRARSLRGKIHDLGDTGEDEKRILWKDAEDALAEARLKGDLLVAAFFAEKTSKAREARRQEYLGWWQLAAAGDAGALAKVEAAVTELREGEHQVVPLHWEIEFPEVFARNNSGFDCFTGNPPFLGGTMISTNYGDNYFSYLKTQFDGTGNRADLVAYFFRRVFQNLNQRGCFGLISTNTIGQGDTRTGGLLQICRSGGTIFNAKRRYVWPGMASVVVSIIHASKLKCFKSVLLDNKPVERISAFLFHIGPDENPYQLQRNMEAPATLGVKPYGEGFIFENGNNKANPVSKLQAIKKIRDVKNFVKPFIGGSHLNSDPTHTPHRFIIDLGRMNEEEARSAQPELMAILEEMVKPDRMTKSAAVRKTPWWRFYNDRHQFFEKIREIGLKQTIVTARNSQTAAFSILPTDLVANEKIVLFAVDNNGFFATLQSRVHEAWSRFLNATLKDDLQYAISDCYYNFPFPSLWQTSPTLKAAGKAYYEYRARLMADESFRAEVMDGEPPEGLTKTYNRFHDPDCDLPGIVRLRELHAEMDRAVLDAYGWADISTDCEFLLDYPIDEENWNPRKKKPYRYRWPDEVHDEVLARLLELNQQYAEAEKAEAKKEAAAKARAKRAAKKKSPTTKTRRKVAKPKATATTEQAQEGLFGEDS